MRPAQSTLDAIRRRVQAELQNLPPSSAAPPSAVCPTCEGRGFVRYSLPFGHPDWGRLWPCPEAQCPARQAAAVQRAPHLLRKSGLLDKYREMSFQTWLALPAEMRAGKAQALAAAWAWAQTAGQPFSMAQALAQFGLQGGSDEPRAWLVLQGGLGLGKTGLAAAVVQHLVANDKPVIFYRTQEMFSDIQSRYGKEEPPSADDVLQEISRAPRLIIDEANIPSATNDKQRLMEEIIRYRHGRELPTVITCNVDLKGFSAMWGERTADVVAELSHWITLGGPKLRKGASHA